MSLPREKRARQFCSILPLQSQTFKETQALLFPDFGTCVEAYICVLDGKVFSQIVLLRTVINCELTKTKVSEAVLRHPFIKKPNFERNKDPACGTCVEAKF